MDEWLDGSMNWCMDGWKDGWMDGWLDGWIDEWLDGWMNEWMDGYGWIDGWLNIWIDGCFTIILANAGHMKLHDTNGITIQCCVHMAGGKEDRRYVTVCVTPKRSSTRLWNNSEI